MHSFTIKGKQCNTYTKLRIRTLNNSFLSTDFFFAMKSNSSSAVMSFCFFFLINLEMKQIISSLVILNTSLTSGLAPKYCTTSGCRNKGPNSSSSNFSIPSFLQIANSKSYNDVIFRTPTKQ